MIEYDRKRNYNRECLGAFRRGEVQTNNKLWMAIGGGGQSLVKLQRKNVLSIVEGEQVKLDKLIEQARKDIKAKVRKLTELNITPQDMDPYVLKLLLKEQKPKKDDQSDEDDDLE